MVKPSPMRAARSIAGFATAPMKIGMVPVEWLGADFGAGDAVVGAVVRDGVGRPAGSDRGDAFFEALSAAAGGDAGRAEPDAGGLRGYLSTRSRRAARVRGVRRVFSTASQRVALWVTTPAPVESGGETREYSLWCEQAELVGLPHRETSIRGTRDSEVLQRRKGIRLHLARAG